MGIIPFKTDKGEFLAVEVEDGAKEFSIESPYWLAYESKGHDYQKKVEELADGYSWDVIATSTAITEEQAAEIVDKPLFEDYYFDYMNPLFEGWAGGFILHIPKESFTSLMQSIGCDMSKQYVILRRVKA